MRITEASALLVLGALAGATLATGASHTTSTALAQQRGLSLSSSCSTGDLVVFDGSDRLRCIDPEDVELRRCDSNEVLGTDSSGHVRCVGPSSTPWGAEGLLPSCSSGDTLVSEGFGRWRCQSPAR